MNQSVLSSAVRAPCTRSYMVAVVAGISVLLIASFSTRPPWRRAPTERPILHVQPQDRALGLVDGIVASPGSAPGSGNRSLGARGWAVSCVPAVSLTSVIVLVDGKPAGETKSFSPRPDVAAAYGRSDFESSGWNIVASVGPLRAGDHTVTLRAVLANGEYIDLPGPRLTTY